MKIFKPVKTSSVLNLVNASLIASRKIKPAIFKDLHLTIMLLTDVLLVKKNAKRSLKMDI